MSAKNVCLWVLGAQVWLYAEGAQAQVPPEGAPPATPASGTVPPPPPPTAPASSVPASSAPDAAVDPDQAAKDRQAEIAESVVHGVRLDTRARSPYPLSGVSREEFMRQPKSSRLADIIDRMPGVFGSGDLGANTDTGLRGLNHRWTRFEFDGIMLPGMDVGRDFRINRLSPIAVEEVIALRNPPPEYESDGIGGHLVAVRRKVPDAPFLEAIAGVGALQGDAVGAGWVGDVSVAGGAHLSKRLSLGVFADYNRYPTFRRRSLDIVNLSDGSLKEAQTERNDPIFEAINAFADLGFKYGDDEVHVKPMVSFFRQINDRTTTRDVPGSDPRRIESDSETPRMMPGITVSHVHKFSASSNLESDVSYYRSMQDSSGTEDTFNETAEGSTLSGRRKTGREILHHFPMARTKYTRFMDIAGLEQVLKVGAMVRFREYHTSDLRTDLDADGTITGETTPEGDYTVKENYYAAFLQDELYLTDHLTVLGGVRVEYSDNTAEVFKNNDANEVLTGDNTRDSDTFDVNPHLSVNLRLANAWSIRATGSRTINRPGYREQSVLELDRDVIERGNPDLVPTRAWNFDLGVDFQPSKHVFAAVTAYCKYLTDVVEMVDTGEVRAEDDKPIYQYNNIGDGVVEGIEFEQKFGLGLLSPVLNGLRLWANETVLRTEVTLADGTKRPFSAHSNVLANIGADWEIERTGTAFAFAVKYQGDYKNNRTTEDIETTEATWYMNASVGQDLTKQIRLTAEVQNLLGEEQVALRERTETTEASVNQYGRFFRLSARGQF